MKYVALLSVFALVFGGIVYATFAVDSLVQNEQVCAISQMSCGVSSDAEAAEAKPGTLPGIPGPAQPKLKGAVRYGSVTTTEGTCNRGGCVYVGCCGTYCHWQAVRGQPVRNVVRFFHNRRPLRRFLGGLFFCGRCR